MAEENTALSEREQKIKELEEYISNLEQLIKEKKQAENLLHNRDFQELVLETYCKKECVRLLKLAVCEDLPAEAKDDALAMAEDTARIKVFLDNIVHFGAIAERDIDDARKLLDEIESEKEENNG